MHSYGRLLVPRGSKLKLLKSTLSDKNCLALSPVISAQFTIEMCVAALNREQFNKNPYFSGSRSFKVIDVGSRGKLVSSACYDTQQVYVPICNRSQGRVKSGEK